MLLARTNTHNSYPILDNRFSSFYCSYSDSHDCLHDQHYLSESSASIIDPNHPQNQGSNLVSVTETETKDFLKPPFIKRILLIDDDRDITLTFKAGLEGHYCGDKRRFEVYTYNDPLLVLKEFKLRCSSN